MLTYNFKNYLTVQNLHIQNIYRLKQRFKLCNIIFQFHNVNNNKKHDTCLFKWILLLYLSVFNTKYLSIYI